MNISISQITNGFVVGFSSPKGQSAIYCATWEEVLKQLAEMNQPPSNVEELNPRTGNN